MSASFSQDHEKSHFCRWTRWSGSMWRYLVVIRTFLSQRQTSPMILGWWWSSNSYHFWRFLQVLPLSSRDIQVRRRARLFSTRQRRSSSIACGNVMAIQFYHFQGTKVFTDAPDAFSVLSNWQVSLVGLLIGWVMFHSNEISVLSLLPFYLQ